MKTKDGLLINHKMNEFNKSLYKSFIGVDWKDMYILNSLTQRIEPALYRNNYVKALAGFKKMQQHDRVFIGIPVTYHTYKIFKLLNKIHSMEFIFITNDEKKSDMLCSKYKKEFDEFDKIFQKLYENINGHDGKV